MRRRRFRPFRLGLWLGVLAGLVWFAQRVLRGRDDAADVRGAAPSRPAPAAAPIPSVPVVPIVRPEIVEVGDVERPGEPEVGTVDVDATPPPAAPVKKAAAKKKAPARKAAGRKAKAAPTEAWVAPEAGGTCPTSHPVKAKLSSKLFHLPGMFAYERTNPDRCYVDEAAAEADGLRRAKR